MLAHERTGVRRGNVRRSATLSSRLSSEFAKVLASNRAAANPLAAAASRDARPISRETDSSFRFFELGSLGAFSGAPGLPRDRSCPPASSMDSAVDVARRLPRDQTVFEVLSHPARARVPRDRHSRRRSLLSYKGHRLELPRSYSKEVVWELPPSSEMSTGD